MVKTFLTGMNWAEDQRRLAPLSEWDSPKSPYPRLIVVEILRHAFDPRRSLAERIGEPVSPFVLLACQRRLYRT